MKTKGDTGLKEKLEHANAALIEPVKVYLQGLARLLSLELQEALSSLKALLLLSLCLLPLVFLAWVSASSLFAFFAYELTLSVAFAILTFCLIQVVAVIVVRLLMKKYSHRLSFPYTRKELSSLLNGGIKDESLSRNSAATAEAPKPTGRVAT